MFRQRLALALTLVGLALWVGFYLHSRPVKPPPVVRPVGFIPPPVLRHEMVSAAVVRMQSQPLYHKAEAACRHRQFQACVRLLEQLGAQPRLTAEERDFVQQQRDICRQDAGERLPAPAAPPSASAQIAPAGSDCGPRALALVCRQLGVSASVAQLQQWAGTTEKGTSLAGLAKAAEKAGLKAEGVQVSREGLGQVEWPAIAWVNENHYMAVWSVQGDSEQGTATLRDPNAVHEETIPKEKLLQMCGGYLLLLHR